jgi:hypothetical protein
VCGGSNVKGNATGMRLSVRAVAHGFHQVQATFWIQEIPEVAAAADGWSQEYKPSEEKQAQRDADRVAAKRKRELEEFEYELILGARKVGTQVQFKLQWLGGEKRWGTDYRSWNALDSVKALEALGGEKQLEGRRAFVRFSSKVTSLAQIGRYSNTRKKFEIKYPGEESDNEFLDLMRAEKDWEFVV